MGCKWLNCFAWFAACGAREEIDDRLRAGLPVPVLGVFGDGRGWQAAIRRGKLVQTGTGV
jgi:hypothetical protein